MNTWQKHLLTGGMVEKLPLADEGQVNFPFISHEECQCYCYICIHYCIHYPKKRLNSRFIVESYVNLCRNAVVFEPIACQFVARATPAGRSARQHDSLLSLYFSPSSLLNWVSYCCYCVDINREGLVSLLFFSSVEIKLGAPRHNARVFIQIVSPQRRRGW